MNLRFGILGGTFDPIHIGHLIIAEEARHRYDLEKVIFVPAFVSPLKAEIECSSPSHRLKMVELAIEKNDHFSVSNTEIERGGISYTIDTLRETREIYGKDAELFFIVGADAVREMLKWKDPEMILSECTIVAVSRPGFPLDHLEDFIPKRSSDGKPGTERVVIMEIPSIGISSSDIRQRVATGRPFRYMVPEAVWSYIMQTGLYR